MNVCVRSILYITSALIIYSFMIGLSSAGNIDPLNDDSQYSWGENIGWVNLEPIHGPGITVTDTNLSGFAWGENIGWINFSPSFGGVINDGNGQLSGYAWGENVGWINFNPVNGGVRIDACGDFNGEAWGENIGWIRFRSEGAYPYKVTSSWSSPIDDIPPITVTSTPVPEWYNYDPTLTLLTTDCGNGTKEVHYTLNGNPESITQGTTVSFSVLGEGTHSLSFFSIDNVGNTESTNNVTIRIDKTPPVINLLSPANNATYYINRTINADYTITDNLSGVSITSATLADGLPINTQSIGSKSFFVSAYDHASNLNTVTHNYTVMFPGNIDTENAGHQYAWGENVGWINFKPSYGPGVTVSDDRLTGYAWGENIGWLRLDPQYGGVINDGQGQLSGYAWSENAGWINFAPQYGGVSIIPDTGMFSGRAWGENIGWITFSSTGAVPYQVKTSWTPTQPPTIDDLSARAKSGKVSLLWSPIANAESYSIYRSTTQGGLYNLIAQNVVTDYATYLHEGLTNGVTYYYVVTYVAAGEESEPSNETNATPAARARR